MPSSPSSPGPLPPHPDCVFVYGTLRAGQSNAHWMAGAEALGPARTAASYTLFDTGPYPAAVAAGDTALVGEIYRIDAACLGRLDTLEGYPAFYTRAVIEAVFETPSNNEWASAWIYLWAASRPEHWPRIADGDWAAHCRRLSTH